MEFRTIVDIERPAWLVEPAERVLCVGSCFADHIGRMFADEHFPATVNPYGVMYNPASILHTLQRLGNEQRNAGFQLAILTLGTNHVYIEKETGQIVDNCQKRPQALFIENKLTVEECAGYLRQSVALLHRWNPSMKVMLTVSPIRYRKYGYHGSQLSKSTLLLAIEELLKDSSLFTRYSSLYYFPAYEIQRLVETCFSDAAKQYLEEWQPLKRALAHRPFNPESEEYQQFLEDTQNKLKAFETKWKVPS